jgi:hypothetical protein
MIGFILVESCVHTVGLASHFCFAADCAELIGFAKKKKKLSSAGLFKQGPYRHALAE